MYALLADPQPETPAGNREENNTAKPRKSGSQKRQRSCGVYVACTGEELTALDAKAKAAGLSRGAYLRTCALGDAGPRAQRSPTINREIAAHAIAELNKAGSNLNQIAHAVNRADWPGTASIVAAAARVEQAALHILKAFGYKVDDSQG